MTTRNKAQRDNEPAEARRGRGRPQLRSDEDTRVVILEAARHEFASAGYAATNMENVARTAGVSTKTLYRLIPNKATLFEAMITDRVDRFAAVVRLKACEGDDISAALCAALMTCGELVLDGEVIALQRMLMAEGEKFPEIADTFYHKAIRRTESTLASWLTTQHKRGLIRIDDANDAAGMLLGMLALQPQRAVLFGHAAPPGREEIERRARVAAELFLKGCAR